MNGRSAWLVALILSALTFLLFHNGNASGQTVEVPITSGADITQNQTLSGNATSASPPDSITEIALSSPEVILLAVAIIIAAGVVGEAFFRKTGIPDIAFLMVLGVTFGPVLNIISTDVVIQVVPYFAALALIMIMFDGGLSLRFREMISITHFAFPLAIFGFAASTMIVAAVAFFGLAWEILPSILLGAMLGGSSSIVVFGLVRRLSVSEETKALLSLESAVTDIASTIAVFVLFGIMITHNVDFSGIVGLSVTSVAVGVGLGAGVGIPWIYVASKLSKSAHGYMFTLAVLFVLFFLARSLGESGALTALVFGLMLGNKRLISKYLRFDLEPVSTDNTFHKEITFLVRTFFFVFIGLLANLGRIEYVIFGVIMALALYFARIQITKYAITFGAALAKRKLFRIPANAWKENGGIIPTFDRKVVEVMMPRGLAAAVLATIPLSLGLPNAEIFPQVVFVVIISSVVITTIGLTKAGKGPVTMRLWRGKQAPSDSKKVDESHESS